jgi:hypothetical protein
MTNIATVIKKLVKEWGKDPYDINNGECEEFAVKVIKRMGGWDRDDLFDLTSDNFVEDRLLPDHVWVCYKGRHYDAECPEGVDSWKDLPLFKNAHAYDYQEIIKLAPEHGDGQPRLKLYCEEL